MPLKKSNKEEELLCADIISSLENVIPKDTLDAYKKKYKTPD